MMKRDDLAKLSEICLRIANIVDRNGEPGEFELCDELGLGYLALSGYLRAGVKAIIDIQNDLANARADREYARISEQSMREFIVDIFGDEEPETLNDEYKKRIRDFVGELLKEMDGDEECRSNTSAVIAERDFKQAPFRAYRMECISAVVVRLETLSIARIA